MTRVAVLADIHGNLPALEAVAADMAQFAVDRVVVAGDLINCGPFSRQVLEHVVEEGWAVIRGNNELYALDCDIPHARPQWHDRSVYSLLPWLHRQMRGHWQNVVAAWPDTISLRFPEAPPVLVAHGSSRSPWENIYESSLERGLRRKESA